MPSPDNLDLSDPETDFIREILNEYTAIYRETDYDESRPERDLVPRLVDHLFIDVLGHSESDYEQENDWNDVIFRDDDSNPTIIVEAKKRTVDVESGVDQGFEYAADRPYSQYLIVTNIDEMYIYERCDESLEDAKSHGGYTARKIADINFEGLVNFDTGRAVVSDVGLEEYQDLLELYRLQRGEVADIGKYDNFDIPHSAIQDVSDDDGFENLLNALQKCINQYFMSYTLKQFDYYSDKHDEYERKYDQLEAEREAVNDEDDEAEIKREMAEVEAEWGPYRRFHDDFAVWKQLSNRMGEDPAENKRVFCRESVYTQINKILFIRIAEDKGLLNRMVSNGGVDDFFDFWENYARYTGPEKDYADLFEVACDEVSELYEHLYSRSIFDWQLDDGKSLNETFRKTFWHLNHYDFSNVDRDVLGHLYQQHLPKDERKALGEFYTPVEVVNFILDRLGYTADNPIENKDLLDPATGSGTFLVQAANRLVDRLERKGADPLEALEVVQNRIHALDINPFAVNIAQINLVFQIIDLYTEVKEENPDYTLENFKIYQTDSLKRGIDTKLSGFHSDTVIQRYQQDKEQAEAIKSGRYDLVVGNPPYVYYNSIPEGQRETYNNSDSFTYENGDVRVTHNQYDISILFLDSVRDWLKPGGQVSYITTNKFINSGYGAVLREYLPRFVTVEEFIDFADAEVFEDAVNYPCVFVMTRKSAEEEGSLQSEYSFPFVGVKEVMDSNEELLNHISSNLDESHTDEYVDAFPVRSSSLDKHSWKFIPEDDTEILDAIRNGAESDLVYDDLCDRVELGIKTGEDDAFVVDRSDIDTYDLEEEILHPTLVGEDVERWRQPTSDSYLIYADPNYDIDDYPNIKGYLDENYREELEDRTHTDSWWELREPRRGAANGQPKILTPDIAYYNNFCYDETGAYPLNTCYYAAPDADEHFLLGLANSIVMQFWMRMEAPTYGNDYLRYYGTIWGELPVARNDRIEDKISSKTEEIVEFLNGLERAEEILGDPREVYDEFSVETVPLAKHSAIESFELDDTEVEQPITDEDTIMFQNLTAEINFFDEGTAYLDIAADLIRRSEFETTNKIRELQLPVDESDCDLVMDELENAESKVDSAREDVREYHDQLDDLVCELYGFDDQAKALIRDRTPTPNDPLDTRIVEVSDEDEVSE